jgi:ribosomal protein L24
VVKGEHKGKEGVIKAMDNTRNQVIVEGINIVSSFSHIV